MADIDEYIASLPDNRKQRMIEIREIIRKNFPEVTESMKYKMPTFEYSGNWVAAASQKHYLSIYFCQESLIMNIKQAFPKLSYGKACVRLKDKDIFPRDELEASIIAALTMVK